ncbi:Xylanase inhibitor C-terminal [Arabidopsis suecica]|uniref:Xylanase inhibitor C-terminal n=1 Tax=Arabidopsis suecica TaxID=45249 RepID=A0A8T2BQZ8_ARASU|nr:Xylanase inhibitor C-terminal [Arabidopsis suecica]
MYSSASKIYGKLRASRSQGKEGTNRGKASKGSNLSELYGSLTAVKGFRANKPKHGFSLELIHHDSPKSPFYNPGETSSQRMRNAVRRSARSTLQFSNDDASPNSPQSVITSNRGEYLMNISIGTPPFPILAIADTGSDLIWTQCNPCKDCYKQKAPLFDPKQSSTYRKVSCSSSHCRALEEASCSTDKDTCSYTISYGDNSYTKGEVAVDTLTIGSSRIIGLGGGSTSLVSQLGKFINGKFSYCLVPLTSEIGLTSKINFGTNGFVSGDGVVSTPLVKKDPATFYFLTLEAISVGSKKIHFTGTIFGTKEGNIVIDSGTTLNLLPSQFYSELESAVASTIKAERVQDPNRVLSLCYRDTSSFKVPDITVHFKGGDVKLHKVNTFVEVSEDVSCFAFAANEQLTIYGNLAQMNFFVGYDTVSGTVSFKRTDCAQM